MEQDGTTYLATPVVEYLETVVGDEMQDDALPRVKIKGWDNEVNLSVGVIYDETPHTMELEGDTVVWQQGDTTATFEQLVRTTPPDTHISLIDEGEITPQRIAAEYEVDRYFNWGQTVRIHKSNEKALMYYGFYNANEFIDRAKLDIPEVRLSATSWNDPMTMDNQLVLIDVHYDKDRDDLKKIHISTITAITEVLSDYGVAVYHATDNIYKLYYRDGDRDVKFFSTGFFEGHYYYYINIEHDYNGALEYSNDPDAVPRSDTNAYGLKTVADVPDTLVAEIITRYAELYGLPLVPRVFTAAEEAKISEIEIVHNNENWIVNGKRDDVWRLTANEQNEDGFEFDITLTTKPNDNVYTMSIETKGLIFSKQEAISDDKLKTEFMSPRAVGSYAAYHDSKQSNEYKSGKAFHIYRPIIKDADGWEVWGDIEIDTEMHITIPQDFIDTATYPIVIDPTFGYTTTGASFELSDNKILASYVTLASAGNLGISIAERSSAGNSSQMALYDGSGSLLYTGGEVAGYLPSLYNYTNHPTLYAADYILAVWTATSGYGSYIYYDVVAGTSYSLSSTYSANNFPVNMSSFTTQTSRRYTVYGVTGYQWPVMVGNSTALSATQSYNSVKASPGQTWTTTDSNNSNVIPTATALHDFRFDLTTAPGVGTSRQIHINTDTLYASISNTAVSAINSSGAVYSAAGTLHQVTNAYTGAPATSTVNRWRLATTNTNQGWYSTSGIALSTTLTSYIAVVEGAGALTATAGSSLTMPNDTGTIVNAYCKLLDGTLASGSYVVTLVKNGSATAMTMTLNSANSFNSYAPAISVTNGDTLYWQIVPTTPSTSLRVAISCEYASNTPGNGIIFGGRTSLVSGTSFSSGHAAWNATEANIQALSYAHTVKGLRVDLSVAPGGATTRTIDLRLNGVTQTPTVTIAAAALTGSWSGSLAVATDNLINIRHTESGAPAASTVKWSYVFSATAFTTNATSAPKMMLLGTG